MVRQNSRTRPQTLERQPEAPALATVAREISHGRTTVVITWDFPAGRDAVWAMLTCPDRLALWAPYTADRDLSHVGRAVLRMLGDDANPDADLSSVVLVADPPRALEHSWGADLLAWQLSVVGSASRLTLRQTLADHTTASAIAAGWHLCLVVAESVLAGHPLPPIRGMDAMDHGWLEFNERYARALGVPATVTP